MWKILIADDEPTIRSGLRMVIEEELDLPLRVCAEARNGIEALEQVRIHRPDIVLADISMPRLNGIEMIEALRAEKADVQVIIITGFDAFEYAKQAINLEVSDYLLKPIDVDELRVALEKVMAEMETRRRQDHFQVLIQQQLDKHLTYFQGKFLNQWIEEELSFQQCREQCELLQIHLEGAFFLFMLGASERQLRYEQEGAIGDRLIYYTLTDVIDGLLAEVNSHYVFTDRYRNIIALIPDGVLTQVDILQRLREPLEQLLGESCRIGIRRTMAESLAADYAAIREELSRAATYRPVVMQAQRYIMEHFNQPELDLTEVARAIGSSPSYLSRLMKQESGSSFKEFLTHVRINRAELLMRTTDESFYRIAELSGYRNQHYFSTAFKNLTGMSPSEYKRSIGEERGLI
ncbi:MAG: response regulator [Eubacteriales bacterium]|nr:response regulator [Eubacteriales bacterium]